MRDKVTSWDQLPVLLTVWPETAAILRVNKTRAYAMAREGAIPGLIKLGRRRYRVSRDVLRRWLEGGGQEAVR